MITKANGVTHEPSPVQMDNADVSRSDDSHRLSRRSFLKLGSAAAIAAVVAGTGGYLAFQSSQPTRTPEVAVTTQTPLSPPANAPPSSPSTAVPKQVEPTGERLEPRIIRVPEDYPSINEAIAAASDGDILRVGPGTYPGFTADKSLSVNGFGSSETIINGQVKITASGVRITSLTIEYAGENTNGTAVVLTGGGNNEVSNNVIKSAGSGVFILASNDNIVLNNTIISRRDGIVMGGRNNIASRNSIEAGNTGLSIGGSDNKIKDNAIKADLDGVLLGVIYGGIDAEVSGNMITAGANGVEIIGRGGGKFLANKIKSRRNGVSITGGVGSNRVLGNTIEATGGIGVSILLTGKNAVLGNTVTHSEIGVFISSEGNAFFKNNLIDNKSQATDNGSNNAWDKGGKGNYWSDWMSVDKPYVIPGKAKSVDKFPLASPYQVRVEDLSQAGSNGTQL